MKKVDWWIKEKMAGTALKRRIQLRKIISACIIFSLMVTMCPISLATDVYAASVVNSGTCGDNLTWTLDNTGTLTISGTGPMTDYTYDSLAPWNSNRFSIKKVVMEENVSSIGNYAFYYCDQLTSVSIPDGVTAIGSAAFTGCEELTGVSIPEGVTDIGSAAFSKCTKLTSVSIPNSVTFIDSAAFCDCSNLTGIYLPDSITSISARVFDGCSGLTGITIPDGVTSIGAYAFLHCTSLKSITLPDGVTSIGNRAFSGCTSLTSVSVPNSITTVDQYAFQDCPIWGKSFDGAKYIGNSTNPYLVLLKGSSVSSCTVHSDAKVIAETAFIDQISLKTLVISDSVTHIGGHAFSGCSNLSVVTMGNSVTSILFGAFYNCSSLATINIPASVTSIGDYAFCGCKKLNSVKLPNSVTTIGPNAYAYCEGLTEITFPSRLSTIGNGAFHYCTALEKVHIPSVEAWCNIQFDGVLANPLYYAKKLTMNGEEITEITVPDGIEKINDYAFYNCRALQDVVLPDSVTGIGEEAFYNCYDLTSITLPDSMTSIGKNAFYYCRALADISIPDSVISVGTHAFIGCSGLTYNIYENGKYLGNSKNPYHVMLDIPATNLTAYQVHKDTKIIAGYAFSYCDDLTDITIPVGVISIGDSAFYNCTSLANIYYGGTAEQWGQIAIGKGNELLLNAARHIVKLVSIAMKTQPSKTEYWVGESLDTTGLTLTATYSDGSTQEITEGYTVTGFDSATAGEKTVTVTYEGFTATVAVTVKEPTITDITVKTRPGKTEYWIGESLDTTGLTLTATYSDNSTKEMTEGFTVAGFDSATTGEQTITVSYENFTAAFTVTVKERPVIDKNAPQVILESKKVVKGSEFTVTVEVKNNPGFYYLEMTPSYASSLTLVSVDNGQLISDFTKGNQYIWVADEDVAEDGLLMTFTFATDETVEPGNYRVSFQVRTCGNYNEEELTLSVVAAEIAVIDYVYGDATGDGVVDGFDVIRLKKYLANFDYETESSTIAVSTGADANGDGVIDGFDVIRLKKYLASYDYETGSSTVVLGPQ